MLKNIGVFHFCSEDRTQPLESLRISIQEAGGKAALKDSLVVLPEAFNILTKYESSSGTSDTDPIVISRLKDLAEEFELAFVAGLIVKEPTAPGLAPSSAYIIHSSCCALLSRKMGRDDMADVAYAPVTDGHDCPVILGQACIAALICMDATALPSLQTNNRARHAALRDRMAKLGSTCPIFCVPAYTKYFSTTGIATEWPDFHFVLANGFPGSSQNNGHPSVIWIKGRDAESFQQPTK